jgi:hypothetical protein
MALRTTTTSSQRSTTALTSTRGRGAIVRKTALQSAVGGQGTSAVLAVTRPATVGANLGESFVFGSSYPRRRWSWKRRSERVLSRRSVVETREQIADSGRALVGRGASSWPGVRASTPLGRSSLWAR